MQTNIDIKTVKRIFFKLRYYVLFTAIVFLSVAVIAYQQYTNIDKTSQDIAAKQAQVSEINRKIKLVNQNTIDSLRDSTKQINTFMPNELDLFSMLTFIDNITKKEKLRVGTIVLQNTLTQKGTVSKKDVSLLGDISFEEFLSFLDKYKYITGRLLVVKNVNITTLKNDTIDVTAEIYSYEPIVNLENLAINELTENERALLKRIQEVAVDPVLSDDNINDSYTSKENPFN